jgi:dimethylhistidine N-methyltransferase
MRNLALEVSDIDTPARSMPACAEFAESLLLALRSRPRRIAPKFFYDEAGSALFEAICALDEYYLTRCEVSILRQHAAQIAHLIGLRAEIIEFGAGSGSKIRILLDALARPTRYVPVDLSVAHLDHAARALVDDYPGLEVAPLAADFTRPLVLTAHQPAANRRVGVFLGSTIGNLSLEQAHEFLGRAAVLFRGGGLLVGVDLVKDPAVLHRAYNDAQGTTAAFNRNLLVRANRELDADFDPAGFRHYAFYEPLEQRIQMHLVSARQQTVHVCREDFVFQEGESLHTENSQKYTIEGFGAMARRAGFAPGPVWCDPNHLFSVHWLAAPSWPTGALSTAR